MRPTAFLQTMLSSAITVAHLASGSLRVAAPPDYGLMLLFLGIGLLPFVYFLYRAVKVSSLGPVFGALLCSAPFFLAALATHRNGSVLLDKASNTATITSPSWLWHRTQVIPLSDVQRAELHFGRNGSWIALVLQDGDATSFSDSTGQSGQGRAAQAINDYLGVPRR